MSARRKRGIGFLLASTIITWTFCSPTQANIIVTNYAALVTAEFNATPVSASSGLPVDSLSVTDSGDNSFTTTDLSWNWDGTTLTGSSLLTEEKTVAARPGGRHAATSSLAFEFTVNSTTEYTMSGTWGFETITGTDEVLGFTLTETSLGPIDADNSTGTTGINSDTFSSSGTLAPGTYTLTFSAELYETINNAGLARAGWTLTEFNLTAVPEPGSICGLLLLLGLASLRTRLRS